MKSTCSLGAITILGSLLLFSTNPAAAASGQLLQGHVPAAVKSLQLTGQFPGTNRLNLAIALPLRNPAALSNLLQQIYDPASPQYHHYLTPEQFAERFGPTKHDYQAVAAFANANGLRVTATHPNRVLVDVSGSAADVERALHVTLHTYRHPTENRTFYSPDTEPTLDLAVPILHISGLNNYSLPRPRLKTISAARGQDAAPNAGSGPSGSFMGRDFRAAYVPDTALNGSGQTVGLLQFDGYTASDITYYETKAGLPNVLLQNVLIDGASGLPSGGGGEIEVSLDIEMAISMATNVSRVMVYEAPNPSPFVDLLSRMANDNLAKQLSCSWYMPNGAAEPAADEIFQQMAAQGQSFFNASGDYDAYTGLIDFPGDTPYITQVGGTTLTTSGPGGSWVSETVWNWGIEYGRDGIGSGGGISTQYPIPSWQTNINMTANQGSVIKRNTPDVALTADHVYVRADGFDYVEAGTSCAAPLWAGFAALANQQAAAAGRPAVGFINPLVDAIGTGANYTSAFHDITTGNNTWSGSPAKFYAVTGYDLCTGWGTPAGQNLINALANPEPLLITPATGFSSTGGVGGPFTVTSENLSLTNAGTNSLTWTFANPSAWLDVTSGSDTLTPGGPASIVKVSLNSVASNLVAGIYNATVWFTNLNDNVGQGRQFTLSVISPPVITTQPANQAVLEGATAAFTVTATGGLPLAYQWQDNGTNLTDGGNISGSATTNLVIGNVSSNNIGTYTVTVTNIAGAVASSNALLTFTPSAPVIIMQPSNQTAIVGGTAAFAVAAIGTTPFFYQWSFNGTNIVGATSISLTLANVQLTNAGSYFVTVTNINGSATSSNAVLTVLVAPPCDPAPSGLVAWWQAEGNAKDSIGTNNGTLVGGVTYTNGEVGRAFLLNSANATVALAASPSLNVGAGAGFTVEGWVNPSSLSQAGPIVEWNNGSGTYGTQFYVNIGYAGNLYANIVDSSGSGHVIYTGAGAVASGVFQHVALTYDKASGVATMYCNGVAVLQQAVGSFTPQTTYDLYLGGRPSTGGTVYSFAGLMDEVTIYSRALSPAEIAAIYNIGIGGKCPVPPTILVQPASQTVAVGNAATFTVQAVGTQPLGYQWSFNGTNIVNATNISLTLANLQLTNAGSYAVTVTNFYGSATSSNAVLSVLAQPPLITSQPISQTTVVGGTASFSVIATGSVPMNYVWKKNGTNIVGATSTNFTIVNVTTNDAATYSVAITNVYGSAVSSNAVLTVFAAPPCDPAPSGLVAWWQAEGNANDSIGTNNGTLVGGITYTNGEVGRAFVLNTSTAAVKVAANPALNVGTGGGFTVESWINPSSLSQAGPIVEWNNGSGSYAVQFYVNIGYAGNLYANIVTTGGSGHVIYTGAGAVASGVFQHVALTYDKASGIAKMYCNGALLLQQTVGNNFMPQTTYDLYLGGRPSTGGTVYSFAGLMDEVSLYNRALSAAEIAAIYNAGAGGKCSLLPTILIQPTNQTVLAGATANFSVTAIGSAPIFYQWSFDGTNILGATNTLLTLTNVQFTQAGVYTIQVVNAAGSVTSSNAVLTVNSAPAITSQPANQIGYIGTIATFTVTAIGSTPLKYQWNFNGTNISTATNTTLLLTNIQFRQAGNYTVLVTNNYGSVMSSNATLIVNPALYFNWNPIPSPRFRSVPFAVTIQAQNPTNGLATNFTDVVLLLSTNGVPVSPAVSGNFIQGVWTGTVTVARSFTNLVLEAADSVGETGLANPVNIVNLPALTAVPSSSTFYIFWPVDPSGFVLETTAGLSPGNWVPVTTPPLLIGNQYLLPVQMAGTNAFYRLRFNGQ